MPSRSCSSRNCDELAVSRGLSRLAVSALAAFAELAASGLGPRRRDDAPPAAVDAAASHRETFRPPRPCELSAVATLATDADGLTAAATHRAVCVRDHEQGAVFSLYHVST